MYEDVRKGIGFNKSPKVYGAFPTDPYSHTPASGGARQPGMTGQVKEEVLTRLAEVGLRVEAGHIVFDPVLLRKQEMLDETTSLHYVDTSGQQQTVSVDAGQLAYTFCQVPVAAGVAPVYRSVQRRSRGSAVDRLPQSFESIFMKRGEIAALQVALPRSSRAAGLSSSRGAAVMQSWVSACPRRSSAPRRLMALEISSVMRDRALVNLASREKWGVDPLSASFALMLQRPPRPVRNPS